MGNLLDLFVFKYNRTDFHELNLDWIISDVKTIAETLKNFVNINTIKYADPIQWNITKQYEKNVVVVDPDSYTAYLSVNPVPVGVDLSRTEYWTPIFDLGQFVTKIAKNFTDRYEEESAATATFNSNAGDWLIWGDVLYNATVNITAGDAYIVGSNIQHFTMEYIINTALGYIGNLGLLKTANRNDLVSAINEVIVNLAGNFAFKYEEITNDTATITSNAGDWLVWGSTLYNVTSNIAIGDPYTVGSNIQHFTIESVINTILTRVGDLDNLTTTNKTNIVNAINEVNGKLTSWGEFNRQYGGKKIAIVGDSLSVATNTWAEEFKTMAESFGCTVDNHSISGGTTATLLPVVESINDAYDVAIIWLGVNDANNAYPIGNVSTANTYVHNVISIIAKFTALNNLCKIFAIATPYAGGSITLSRTKSTYYYNAALLQVCKLYGAAFKDLSNICNASYYNHNALAPDEVHFYGTESKGMVLNAILNKILVPTCDAFEQIVNINENDVTAGTNVTISTLRGRLRFGDFLFFNSYLTTSAALSGGDTILTLPAPIKGTYINQVLLIDTTGKCYFGLCSLNNEVTMQGSLPAGPYRMFLLMTMQDGANITFVS